ncbi:MAG: hypothetical protein KDC79_11290 [Cyclobacteriaceae bacterium]|nr:hypothetical protein [Cyclobacteriaceae bacterium]
MEPQELKKNLQEYIDGADRESLQRMYDVIYSDNPLSDMTKTLEERKGEYVLSSKVSEAIKNRILNRLNNLDEEKLKGVEDYLDRELELSKSLDRALLQVEEGKVTPHSVVRTKYEKWL